MLCIIWLFPFLIYPPLQFVSKHAWSRKVAYRDIKDRNKWFNQTSKWLIDKKNRWLLPNVCVFALIEFSYKLLFEVGWQQNFWEKTNMNIYDCMKCNLSVIWDKLHFLFECPTCNDYCTRFVVWSVTYLSFETNYIFFLNALHVMIIAQNVSWEIQVS